MDKSQIKSDCKRFAYLYRIELSGSERNGIAVMAEGYSTAFDTWAEVMEVFRTFRDGASFREACINPVKFPDCL